MEDLRSYIPEEEKEHISEYIDCYMDEECEKKRADIDYILRIWAENKKPLFQLLGENLTLSRTIDYEIDTDELIDKIADDLNNDILSENAAKFFNSMAELVWEWYPYNPYRTNDECIVRDFLFHLTDESCLAENKMTQTGYSKTIIIDRGPHMKDKPLEIKTDAKLMRIYSKLVDWFELNKQGFEEFRLVHSRWLNDRKIKSNLVLSIHPLDYMTMSDNNCNWESCMNWYSHGDYRIGTIEMMNSPMVVEAYLEADHPYYPIDNRSWTWSNKRWRCLYIVHPDIITEIKQYPYHNEFLSKEILGWLKELAQKNNNWAYKDNLFSVKSSAWNEIDDTKYYIKMSTNGMYCDYYDKHNSYIGLNAPEKIRLNYSGETECMCCGRVLNVNDFQESDRISCAECSGFVWCSCCETWAAADEMSYDDDGNAYCYWCASDKFNTCDCCGETKLCDEHFKIAPNGFTVAVFTPKNIHSMCVNSNTKYICDDCWADLQINKLNSWVHPAYYDLYLDAEGMSKDLLEQLAISEKSVQSAKEHLKATYLEDYEG